MFVSLLIGSLFIVMYLSVNVPFGVTLDGIPIQRVSLTFKERLLFRRRNIYSLGVILLLSAIGHWFPTTVELGLIALGLCINALPTRYQFTTVGVACNNTLFRRWDEFTSVQIKGARLIFIPRRGFSPLKLVLFPSHQREILPIVERFLRVDEQESSLQSHPFLSWLRIHLNRSTLYAVVLSLVLMLVGSALLTACGEMGQDPSGLNTANQQNLTHVTASGTSPTISSSDLKQAKAQEPFAYKLALYVDENRLGVNFIWTLVTGYLVMFMQLGFALVETGFCRAKNAAHTMAMNFMIYGIAMMGYFSLGFAFQFGGVGLVGVPNLGGLTPLAKEISIPIGNVNWGILGFKGFFFNDGTYDSATAVLFLFQMVFMDTGATIPTGAMAERFKWSAFCVFGLFFSTLVYPVFGNWAWGGGWLSQLSVVGLGAGYVDFAGSGVVHAVGGWTALAGAMVLGPRIGKYNPDGSSNTIPGHNLVLAIAGCFILAFGWFGFNPGSTLGASGNGDLRIGIIAVDTMLSGACGSLVAMCYTWIVGAKKPDLAMMGNGLLAGLVAITAPSGYVSPIASCIIGGVAGFLVVFATGVIDKVLKVDDPVGAIAVHGVNGAWGQLSVGLFADGMANYGGLQVRGIFFGDSGQLIAQLIGIVTCFVYVFGISWLFFKIYDMLFGMRVSAQTELAGLDIPEMGTLAYPPDAETSSQPAAAGIASAAPAWQPPQLGQPLPASLRVRSPQQSQAGHINPNYQERPASPNYQERPASPNYQERPASPNYQERPASPNYQERPASPNYQERPASPNYQERPASSNYQERSLSPDYQERPLSPDYQERPLSPDYQERPAPPSGDGIQSEAWWQNQRNRPHRITFDSEKQ
jgi:Amt family ammonium transporter